MKPIVPLVGLLLLPVLSNAVTVYSVDRNIQSDDRPEVGPASVYGTLTTDSTTGVLSTANILDWSLLLNNGIETFLIDSSNSEVRIFGISTTATPTELRFDFSGPENNGFYIQYPFLGSGQTNWCFATNGCIANSQARHSGEKVLISGPGTGFGGNVWSDPYSGVQTFATAVPVPAAVWLFGSALVGIGWFRQKQTV